MLEYLRGASSVVGLDSALAPGTSGGPDGRYCLVLEALGENLTEWLVKERLKMNSPDGLDHGLLKVAARQVVLGVHALHALKVVHLDIKLGQFCWTPGNILKIVDFDAAQILGGASQPAPLDRATVECCSPEVADAMNDDGVGFSRAVFPSYAIDLYGLGLVLRAVLTCDDAAPFATVADARAGVSLGGLRDSSRALVEPLLNRDPAQRPSAARLRSSVFFTGAVTQIKEAAREAAHEAARVVADSAAAQVSGLGDRLLGRLGDVEETLVETVERGNDQVLGKLDAIGAGLGRLEVSLAEVKVDSAAVVRGLGDVRALLRASEARTSDAGDASLAMVHREFAVLQTAVAALAPSRGGNGGGGGGGGGAGGGDMRGDVAQLRADVLAALEASAGGQADLKAALARVAGAVKKVGLRVDEGFKDLKVDLGAMQRSLNARCRPR